jgi:hypothetical protein
MTDPQQPESYEPGTVKPTGELVTDETAASAAQAAENANLDMSGYPQTSGDLDPSQEAQDEDLQEAMKTVDGVRTFLADASDPDERGRRADAVEAAENDRDGDNRKGVIDAIEAARQ